MEQRSQPDQLLLAWVQLSAILKKSQFTKELSYNEAIIMLHLYEQWQQDGEGVVPIKEIIVRTGMLKSLVNRTVNSLEEKGLLVRCPAQTDKRVVCIRCCPEKISVFLQVHQRSTQIARSIEQIIGPEDTAAFIRIVDKISRSGYQLKENE